MLSVIADDLTGAAELGGLGLHYGLTVEISTGVNPHSRAGLLIITTDTRSGPEAEAVEVMTKVTTELARLQPQLLFKKIDSVLRGHILAETEAHLKVLHLPRALIVAANPSLKRTITNGTYYYQGRPIHESSFAHDPEFPVSSPLVTDMLRAGDHAMPVHVCKKNESLPSTGIIIGEVQSAGDLEAWAERRDEKTFLAGASGFFTALLGSLSGKMSAGNKTENIPFQSPSLFVCGSTFQKSRNALKAEKAKGGPVSYMPEALVKASYPEEDRLERWKEEILSLLRQHRTAMIAIDAGTTESSTVTAASLREKMARVVQKLFEQMPVNELLIEGGSTASAVLRQLGLATFYPVSELAPGVIRLRTDGPLCITLKPGSYDWPEAVKGFR